AAAQAVTHDVRAWDLEIIEQPCHIVGEVLEREIALDVGSTPVTLHFDGNHFPRFGKFADPHTPVVCNCHERAVKQHYRLAAAVDLVIHFESVNRSIARGWFLLPRYDTRQQQD